MNDVHCLVRVDEQPLLPPRTTAQHYPHLRLAFFLHLFKVRRALTLPFTHQVSLLNRLPQSLVPTLLAVESLELQADPSEAKAGNGIE